MVSISMACLICMYSNLASQWVGMSIGRCVLRKIFFFFSCCVYLGKFESLGCNATVLALPIRRTINFRLCVCIACVPPCVMCTALHCTCYLGTLYLLRGKRGEYSSSYISRHVIQHSTRLPAMNVKTSPGGKMERWEKLTFSLSWYDHYYAGTYCRYMQVQTGRRVPGA